MLKFLNSLRVCGGHFCGNLFFAHVHLFLFRLGGVSCAFVPSELPHFRARAVIVCFYAFAFPLLGLLPVFASRFLLDFTSDFACLLFCFSACPLLCFSALLSCFSALHLFVVCLFLLMLLLFFILALEFLVPLYYISNTHSNNSCFKRNMNSIYLSIWLSIYIYIYIYICDS